MKHLLVLFVLVAAAAANVDIIDTDQGLCVGWISSSGPVVKNVDESCQIQFSPSYSYGHISIGDGPDSGVSTLLVAVSDHPEGETPDSLMMLQTQTMTRLSSREVVSDSILEDPEYPAPIRIMAVSRYDYDMRHLLACIMGESTSTLTYTWVTNSIISLDGNDLDLTDHKQCAAEGPLMDYSRSSRPYNLMGNSFIAYRAYNWFSGEYSHAVVSLSYDMPTAPTLELPPLWEYTLYGETNYNPDWAKVIAAGSDMGLTVALWGDCGLQNVYSSIFVDDVQPAVTEPFPFPYPVAEPSAMSCHPYYNGMLLAWVQGSELRCRHFDGEWNGYDHIVQTGLGNVADQDIAVCSDVDGYWIAWLESGAAEPELVYVPRDSVTGIAEGGISPAEMELDLYPNPFSEVLHIQPSGFSGGCRISIYDTAGRVVESAGIVSGSWEWDAGYLPAGLYSVVAESPEGSVTRRVMHIGGE